MHSRIVNALKKLGAKCCKEGTHVHGDNVDGLLECIAEHYAGGGSSGGLSIKSITFTDRPTAYEWLNANSTKAIKAVLTALYNGVAVTLPCNSVYNNGGGCIWFVGTIGIHKGNGVDIWYPMFEINNQDTKMAGGEFAVLKVRDDSGIELTYPPRQDFPDEYWAALSAQLTVYYID